MTNFEFSETFRRLGWNNDLNGFKREKSGLSRSLLAEAIESFQAGQRMRSEWTSLQESK